MSTKVRITILVFIAIAVPTFAVLLGINGTASAIVSALTGSIIASLAIKWFR